MPNLWTKCWICDKKIENGQNFIIRNYCDNCLQEKLKFSTNNVNSNGINLSSTKTDIDLDIIDSNLILIKTLQSQLMEKSDIILR
jgi:hypothetical protein